MGDGKLRWRLAEEETGGQLSLLDEPEGWHAGHGEFRGLEFLHVRAKRIINEVLHLRAYAPKAAQEERLGPVRVMLRGTPT